MNRRDLLALFGGAAAAAAWPFTAWAQQTIPTIGLLGAVSGSQASERINALLERLRELGWIDGRNVRIEYRWASANSGRFEEIANEFARLKVDLIFANSTEAVLAAKRVTSTIPIVFPAVGDPVENGLVTSLSRPGGNVTGLSNQQADLAGKRLQLLREIVPDLRRIACMGNPDSHNAASEMAQVRAAADALNIKFIALEVRTAAEIKSSLVGLKDRADALYVTIDPLIGAARVQIIRNAVAMRLPTMHDFREHVVEGGMVSYGPNFPDLYRRSADFVDKILRGAKPADLPVEQPTKFDLVVNLRTAHALGITVPPTLLARADEIIE